jgi:hypothetical protein
MRAKKTAIAVRCCPADRVKLMIAEHGEGRFGLAHSPRNPQNFSLLGPTINKITDKDYFSHRVAEHASKF